MAIAYVVSAACVASSIVVVVMALTRQSLGLRFGSSSLKGSSTVMVTPRKPAYVILESNKSGEGQSAQAREDGGAGEEQRSQVSVAELIWKGCPSLVEGFKPSWWLNSGHLQTMYCVAGNFLKVDRVEYERRQLELPDGGTIAVDFSPPRHESLPSTAPTLIIAHGLTGGSHESYVRNVAEWVVRPTDQGGMGGRVVVSNYRGCAGSTVTSPQFYSAGYTGDYHTVVSYVASKYPESPLLGAGFSLGASVVARYLGEQGDQCRLRGAVVMGCPWDIPAMSKTLESGWFSSRVYSPAMAKNLVRTFTNQLRSLSVVGKSCKSTGPDSSGTSTPSSTVSVESSPVSPSTIRFPNDEAVVEEMRQQIIALDEKAKRGKLRLRDVDNALTCRYGGLRQEKGGPFPLDGADKYYEWASSKRFIEGVRRPAADTSVTSFGDNFTYLHFPRPLLGINAFDDPIIDGASLPVDEAQASSHVVLAVTPGGGHLGWFDGPFFSRHSSSGKGLTRYPQQRWISRPVSEFLTTILETVSDPVPPDVRLVEIQTERNEEDDRTWSTVKGSEKDLYGRVAWVEIPVNGGGQRVKGAEDDQSNGGVLQGL